VGVGVDMPCGKKRPCPGPAPRMLPEVTWHGSGGVAAQTTEGGPPVRIFDGFMTLLGALAWPAGVVILALIFKKDLRKLIRRLKKLKTPAGTATFNKKALAKVGAEADALVPEPVASIVIQGRADIEGRSGLEAGGSEGVVAQGSEVEARAGESEPSGISGVTLIGLTSLAASHPAAAISQAWDLLENAAQQAAMAAWGQSQMTYSWNRTPEGTVRTIYRLESEGRLHEGIGDLANSLLGLYNASIGSPNRDPLAATVVANAAYRLASALMASTDT
jgi:hypothetical protein